MRNAAIALTLFATPLAAQDLTVQFAGGTAYDSISFQTAGCSIANAVVLIDLAGSQGKLMFDSAPGGTFANANQPVEITHGYGALSKVRNGDQRLQMLVQMLSAGDTLDLVANLGDQDDDIRQLTGTGSEIAGASVRIALSDRVLLGVFDDAGKATIALPNDASVCLAAAN